MERGTSWFGAFLFGFVHQLTHSYRPAIVALIIFFVLGYVLLRRVDVRQGILDAGNEVPARRLISADVRTVGRLPTYQSVRALTPNPPTRPSHGRNNPTRPVVGRARPGRGDLPIGTPQTREISHGRT